MKDVGVLDILGVRFLVVEQDMTSWPTGQMGLTDAHSARITLGDDMAGDVWRNTLLHEVIHAIFGLMGFGQDETKVSAIATGLASMPQLSILVKMPGDPPQLSIVPRSSGEPRPG